MLRISRPASPNFIMEPLTKGFFLPKYIFSLNFIYGSVQRKKLRPLVLVYKRQLEKFVGHRYKKHSTPFKYTN
jgi:hypothetical protein